ncbi:phage-like protein (plasmid) [Peptoclostridium acidaminophilum DSM 3953]|uniref:Phage-like protein n=1 Tax=Peptoclostridium acidaminophilum DSM 3953 TaxID=1286171 RepID=W8T9X7_PEPAC|nr:phage tail tape measure protein [Peptoclostridium acidaminophilum]AHM57690.1 phage-like protein [Peptoclostridium acidaminophilum DSM 3953]
MARDSSSVVARVGLDDRGFQEGVSKIQRSLKVVQSEFAAASSKLGDFGKSTEELKLKSDSLNKQVELQKEKVAALSRSYQESVEKKGADAKATENLKIKLNYANAELGKMQQELKETTNELKIKSSAWHKLSESMDKAGEKMKSMGDKMYSVGSKLSTAVTLPIVGIGSAATKMAMEAVESENLFDVAMGSMAGQARAWSEETSKALGLNAYSVRNSMATYNAMLTSMGLTSDESLKISESLTQLSYDMASFYNLKPEEAFEKLKSGISGEAEPLKALGILVNDTTIKTYAYTHGIAKQGEELTEAQKVQARYGAIMEATKNAQGDLARTMDSPTNKLRIMKEQAQQIGIQFGQLLIPILEKLIAVIKPLLDRFQGLSKEQQDMVIKIAMIAAAIGPVIAVIGKVVAIVGAVSSAFGAASGAIAAAGGAFAIITGPVGIAVGVIAGLIAIGVALYKNWSTIKSTAATVWNGIKTAIENPINAAKNTVRNAVDSIRNFFKNLKIPEIKIPKIKLPHFELKGKFSLSPPQVPKLNVNWYSSGGIFSSPSIIGVGEAGKEAVVPIDKLDEIIARSLEKAGIRADFNGQESISKNNSITNNYEITINNPKPEAAPDSTRRVLLRQSYGLG